MPSVNGMTSTPARRLLRQLSIDSLYVLVGFPLGLIALTVLITGFFLGIGTLIIWIGLPVLTADHPWTSVDLGVEVRMIR